MLLPEVGEMRARDIVRFRERHGPFASVQDLDRVPGIGTRSIEHLRPMVQAGRNASGAGGPNRP